MGNDGISLILEIGIQAVEARHIHEEDVATQKVTAWSGDRRQYIVGRNTYYLLVDRLLDMFGEVFLIQRIMLHLKARQVGIAQTLDVVDDGLHMVGLRSFGVELGLSKRSDAALFPDFALRDDRRTHRTFEKVGWTDVSMGQRIDKGGFARLNGSHHNHHKRLAMYLLSAVQQQMHLSVKFRIPLQIRI